MNEYHKRAEAKLTQAIQEAERFLSRARQLQKKSDGDYSAHPVESGSTRRASLDLTRALAAYRKP